MADKQNGCVKTRLWEIPCKKICIERKIGSFQFYMGESKKGRLNSGLPEHSLQTMWQVKIRMEYH